MARLILALLLTTRLSGPGAAQEALEPDARVQRGEALAASLCAECHAIHDADQSPHAQAPLFRQLERRVDLDSFIRRLREGLTSGHPEMPTFRFTRDDARALVAYLRSIQRR